MNASRLRVLMVWEADPEQARDRCVCLLASKMPIHFSLGPVIALEDGTQVPIALWQPLGWIDDPRIDGLTD